MATKYDVIIVGSGHGGGMSAYILTQAGLKVALVEAGPRLRAGVDYGKHADPYSVLEERLNTIGGVRRPGALRPDQPAARASAASTARRVNTTAIAPRYSASAWMSLFTC